MQIFVEGNRFGHYIVSNDQDDRTVYFQCDFDYCGLARTFGWIPCAECDLTDGTVKCAHRTVSEMIQEATAYLDECSDNGKQAEDPGYFETEE